MLTDGVSDVLESHGMTLSPPVQRPNHHFLHPEVLFPTVP